MSDDEVRALAARFRKEHIPADVIWLDIDYQDRNRPFTVNPKTFPDMQGWSRDMGERRDQAGRRSPIFTSPTLPDQDYAPYDSGVGRRPFRQEA